MRSQQSVRGPQRLRKLVGLEGNREQGRRRGKGAEQLVTLERTKLDGALRLVRAGTVFRGRAVAVHRRRGRALAGRKRVGNRRQDQAQGDQRREKDPVERHAQIYLARRYIDRPTATSTRVVVIAQFVASSAVNSGFFSTHVGRGGWRPDDANISEFGADTRFVTG